MSSFLEENQVTTSSGSPVTATQGPQGTDANAWPVAITDRSHGEVTVTAANALKVDGSAVTMQDNLTQVGGSAVTLAQKTSANSIPVVLASDQSRINTSDNSNGPVTPGAVAAMSSLIGGQFNTSSPAPTNGQQVALQTDASGNLKTAAIPSDGTKLTYSAATSALASVALATDIFTIFGSATKTIRVSKVQISCTQTTAGEINPALIVRSTTNSGGTTANPTKVPHDSNSVAASATVTSYTGNATTLGTTVGTIRADKLFAPAAAATSAGSNLFYCFGASFGQAVVLRGTGQGLCLNLGGTTIAGSSFNIWIEWTEE
jgi:hypothetical protein